jgi:solute carrier family 5 (sodium-coupled monocarboxylate transporter), member 8/12
LLILIFCLIFVTTSLAATFTSTSDNVEMEKCEAKKKGHFTFYDYSVVFAMLTISLKIGIFYGFFEKSSDHMLGSGMSLFPVTLSLATSFITAIELLGNPAEMYFYGAQFALIG